MGIQIGTYTIPYYGLFIVIGVILAAIVGGAQVKKFEKNIDDFIIMAAMAGLGGILGAKLLYLLVGWKDIDFLRLSDPEYLNSIMSGGFVFYGGLIGGLLFMIPCWKWMKIDVLSYINICMPCIPIVHGFGRLGCNAVGCCYGTPYEGFGSIVYHNSFYAPNDIALFPVQKTEAIANLIIATILLAYINIHSEKEKRSLCVYILLYAPIRCLLEYFRDDNRGALGIFSTSQWISIILFISILIYLIKVYGRGLKRVKKS